MTDQQESETSEEPKDETEPAQTPEDQEQEDEGKAGDQGDDDPEDDDDEDEDTRVLIALALNTLVGDVRDFHMDYLKSLQEPWEKLSQVKQSAEYDRASRAAEDLISRVVRMVAAEGCENIAVTLDQYTVKDGIKITLTALNTEDNALTLSRMSVQSGRRVIMVDADSFGYSGSRRPETTQPDQRELDVATQGDPEIDYETQGYSARGNDEPYGNCPYELDSNAGREWLGGWRKCDESLKDSAAAEGSTTNAYEREGWDARAAGDTHAQNPYVTETEECVWWLKGWDDHCKAEEDGKLEVAGTTPDSEEAEGDGDAEGEGEPLEGGFDDEDDKQPSK